MVALCTVLINVYAIFSALGAGYLNFQYAPCGVIKNGLVTNQMNSISVLVTVPETPSFFVRVFDPYNLTSTAVLKYDNSVRNYTVINKTGEFLTTDIIVTCGTYTGGDVYQYYCTVEVEGQARKLAIQSGNITGFDLMYDVVIDPVPPLINVKTPKIISQKVNTDKKQQNNKIKNTIDAIKNRYEMFGKIKQTNTHIQKSTTTTSSTTIATSSTTIATSTVTNEKSTTANTPTIKAKC